MKKNKTLKTANCFFSLLLLILLQTSCQENEPFIGYDDILVNSPALVWGSSINEIKKKYPNVEESGYNCFNEINPDERIKARFFNFYNNQLFWVGVSYGSYTAEELNILKKELQKKHGDFLIEDNGTIESWYIKRDNNNEIVFLINKLQNNTINCSYINPSLRDKDMNSSME